MSSADEAVQVNANGANLVALLAETVARVPGCTAVQDADRSLTYLELHRLSDAAAGGLHALGIRRGDRVAIWLPRGTAAIVLILGVLKAGAAYVPIDTMLPKARLDLMVRSSSAVVVITEAAKLEEVPDRRGLDHTRILETHSSAPRLSLSGQDAACVLFTSGSSGTPKATVLEHGNLTSFARNRHLPLPTPEDTMGQISSLSFDAFHYELWCTLAAGARLAVLPAVPDLIAVGVRERLRQDEVSMMLVPTMAVTHLLAADPDAFAGLRVLCTGGDVLTVDPCRRLLQSNFTGSFVNLYGPTEATTACTYFPVVDLPSGAVPIGRSLDRVDVQVVDDLLRTVEAGEIAVGGAGVARGYLNEPARTADRFRPDPYGAPGSRRYLTGDRGHRTVNGIVYFDGRRDRQVKVRGYRVELSEVEAALSGLAHVHDAAVAAIGSNHDRVIIAFVAAESQFDVYQVRERMEQLVPHYMVPAAVYRLDALPTTDHGKRDWDALERLHTHRTRDGELVGRVEETIGGIWSGLLGIAVVNWDDDFFALGGNSMLPFACRSSCADMVGPST